MQNLLHKLYESYYRRQKYYRKNPLIYNVVSLGLLAFWVFSFKTAVLDANNIPTSSMVPTLKVGDFLFVNKMRYTLNLPFPYIEIPLMQIDTPQRGDIVTFTPPQIGGLIGKTLVKRVVAIPGDEIRVDKHDIFINDVKYAQKVMRNRSILKDITSGRGEVFNLFEESIIDPKTKNVIKTHLIMKDPTDFYDVYDSKTTQKIPPNKYFVMGDNRDNSDDSRHWGLVDLKNIHGKVYMSYFSVDWGAPPVGSTNELNPILLIKEWLTFQRPKAGIRWERIFQHVY